LKALELVFIWIDKKILSLVKLIDFLWVFCLSMLVFGKQSLTDTLQEGIKVNTV